MPSKLNSTNVITNPEKVSQYFTKLVFKENYKGFRLGSCSGTQSNASVFGKNTKFNFLALFRFILKQLIKYSVGL